LSRIQKSKVETIEQLARQRRELLEELVGLEKRERETLAQRVHDGALQYVLVARQDVEEWQAGIPEAPDRVLRALNEASQLLRSVARELHPDVLSRLGLKSALTHLAGNAQRPGLAVEVDARTWPEDERFEAEHIIYSAARELLTNVIKHAKASNTIIQLSREADTALLRISDDGVGISQEALTKSSAEGHIGLPSIRTKILAAGGHFDMRATSPGTEIRISMPLRHATSETDVRPRAVTLV
jgi:two-component system NarL family sensor kinase